MKVLKTERARKNHRKIFDVAIELFEKNGFDAVKMGDIAIVANVARSSVFNHFPSKMDVLAEFFEQFTLGIVEEAQQTRQLGFHAKMDALFLAAGTAATPRRRVLQEVASQVVGHGPLAAVDSEADRHLMSYITEQVTMAQSTQEVRADIEVELLANIVLAIMTATLHDWVSGSVDRTLDTELRKRFEVILHGATPKH